MRFVKIALFFLCIHFNFCIDAFDSKEPAVHIETFKGSEVIPYLPSLAELRLLFYREYPYLYEGDLNGEEKYLNLYATSENSLLILAKRGEEYIGCVAGLPLFESQEENVQLFTQHKIPANRLFCLGEIVLFHATEQSDVAEKLYEQFEGAVIELKQYDTIFVCEIEREAHDPKKPLGAFSSEVIWERRGFCKHPELATSYSWKEVGETEASNHRMVFWSKKLSLSKND